MNKAQEYLLNAGINDIIVSNKESDNPNDWKYLSDVMGEFLMMASQLSAKLTKMDSEICPVCGKERGTSPLGSCPDFCT